MPQTKLRLTGDMEWDYKFPCLQVQVGNLRTWVHTLSFADLSAAKLLAKQYAITTTGMGPTSNPPIDPDILNLCILLYACRQGENSRDLSFEIVLGQEVAGINRLREVLPCDVVKSLVDLSMGMSTRSIVPIQDEERQERVDDAVFSIQEMLASDETWEHLNYFSHHIFDKDLADLEEMPIGDALNVIKRDEKTVSMLAEVMVNMMQMLAEAKA